MWFFRDRVEFFRARRSPVQAILRGKRSFGESGRRSKKHPQGAQGLTDHKAKRSDIQPFLVMEMLREANQKEAAGQSVLHLEVGQPSTGAPAPVIEAARAALLRRTLGYTEATGLPALKRRIAAFYGARYGLSLDPRRVIVTTGSSGGFLLAWLAAFEAGDKVALVRPGYPAYRNILQALDLTAVEVPVTLANRYQPTLAQLEALPRDVRGLILASPSNPCGTMLRAFELESILEWARTCGLLVTSDEIYHGITYGQPEETALRFTDEAIVVNSFSKYFSMTGWRLGWLVVPERFIEPIERLAQNLTIAPPSLSQYAALEVFNCTAELDTHVVRYERNRQIVAKALREIGLDGFAVPDGAFYLYLDVGALTNDASAFTRALLRDTGVAITTGVDFDRIDGHRHVRFSFAGSTEDVTHAMERFTAWVQAGAKAAAPAAAR
jgi:aspartate/methionine/tyrosine aminotransferase